MCDAPPLTPGIATHVDGDRYRPHDGNACVSTTAVDLSALRLPLGHIDMAWYVSRENGMHNEAFAAVQLTESPVAVAALRTLGLLVVETSLTVVDPPLSRLVAYDAGEGIEFDTYGSLLSVVSTTLGGGRHLLARAADAPHRPNPAVPENCPHYGRPDIHRLRLAMPDAPGKIGRQPTDLDAVGFLPSGRVVIMEFKRGSGGRNTDGQDTLLGALAARRHRPLVLRLTGSLAGVLRVEQFRGLGANKHPLMGPERRLTLAGLAEHLYAEDF